MKTYTTPALVARGDVVHNTLAGKPQNIVEVDFTKRKPNGPNLSFGL